MLLALGSRARKKSEHHISKSLGRSGEKGRFKRKKERERKERMRKEREKKERKRKERKRIRNETFRKKRKSQQFDYTLQSKNAKERKKKREKIGCFLRRKKNLFIAAFLPFSTAQREEQKKRTRVKGKERKRERERKRKRKKRKRKRRKEFRWEKCRRFYHKIGRFSPVFFQQTENLRR